MKRLADSGPRNVRQVAIISLVVPIFPNVERKVCNKCLAWPSGWVDAEMKEWGF